MLLLVIGHVVLHHAAGVRDLPLFHEVGILHGRAELVLVRLDQAADLRDVELIDVGAGCGARHRVGAALRAAAVQGKLANAVSLSHLKRDHHGRDDLIGRL